MIPSSLITHHYPSISLPQTTIGSKFQALQLSEESIRSIYVQSAPGQIGPRTSCTATISKSSWTLRPPPFFGNANFPPPTSHAMFHGVYPAAGLTTDDRLFFSFLEEALTTGGFDRQRSMISSLISCACWGTTKLTPTSAHWPGKISNSSCAYPTLQAFNKNRSNSGNSCCPAGQGRPERIPEPQLVAAFQSQNRRLSALL